MPKVLKDYRLKVTDRQLGNVSFLIRENGKVSYFSASETPLALSNLVDSQAAELRFKLKDALGAENAAHAVRAALRDAFPHADFDLLPRVQII